MSGSLTVPLRPVRGISPTLVRRLTGVNYNTILYWIRTDLVRASVQYTGKQWDPVLLSFDDLVEVALVRDLRATGASRECKLRALRVLRRAIADPHTGDLYLDATSDDVKLVPIEAILPAVAAGTPVVIHNISRLRLKLEERARKMRIKLPGKGA